MKFIHTGDWHLGASLKSASFSQIQAHHKRREELYEAFETLCDKVKKDDVNHMYVTGDLFDHVRVKPSLVESVFKQLSQLNAKIFIVIGNHDDFLMNKAYQSLRAYSNIVFFTEENYVYKADQIDVYGFNTSDFSQDKLLEISRQLDANKYNVLCLHGDVFNAHDSHYLMNAKDLEKLKFDYIALGHIHKHQFLNKAMAYSGNLEPLDFSESGSKGYILGNLATKEYDFVPSSKRSFHQINIEIDQSDSIVSIKKKCMQHHNENDYFRFILTGVHNRHTDVSDITLDDLKEAFYYAEFKYQIRPDIDLDAIKESYKDTVIEEIINASNQENHQSVLMAVEALLETGGEDS